METTKKIYESFKKGEKNYDFYICRYDWGILWLDDTDIIISNYYYCPEIKSQTNPIISLIMCCISQKLVNFVGKLPLTLIEPDFDTSG